MQILKAAAWQARAITEENKLPRPGTNVPIEFAVRNHVRQHTELAKEFFQQILEVDWAWISDESNLWDFHGEETNDRFERRFAGSTE